jgi:hypothetical protein
MPQRPVTRRPGRPTPDSKLYQGPGTAATAGGAGAAGDVAAGVGRGTGLALPRYFAENDTENAMGRYVLLWLLGVPILILIWAFGGLN